MYPGRRVLTGWRLFLVGDAARQQGVACGRKRPTMQSAEIDGAQEWLKHVGFHETRLWHAPCVRVTKYKSHRAKNSEVL